MILTVERNIIHLCPFFNIYIIMWSLYVSSLRITVETDNTIDYFNCANLETEKFYPLLPAFKTPPEHIMKLVALHHEGTPGKTRTRRPKYKHFLNALTLQIRCLMQYWKTLI